MRGAPVFVALAVAGLSGCGRDSIFFEIHVPDGMAGARVELFLGMEQGERGDYARNARRGTDHRPAHRRRLLL